MQNLLSPMLSPLLNAGIWEGVPQLPALPGLGLHLDAADVSTITASGNDASQLDDKSGLGNHVLQGVAANQPKTGLVTVNQLNAMNFLGGPNASGSWMQRTGMNLTIQEWFFVIAVNSVQVQGGISGLLSTGSDKGNIRINSGGTRIFRYDNTLVIPGAGGDANDLGSQDGQWNPEDRIGSVAADLHLPDDTPTRVHCTRGSAINGVVYDNLMLGGDDVAGGRFMTFIFCELIGTDVVQTNDKRYEIRSYLRDKWGVA